MGGGPIVVIGGELDRSMFAAVVGAAERDITAFFVPTTANWSKPIRLMRVFRQVAESMMNHFAIELSTDGLFSLLKNRESEITYLTRPF